MDTQRIVLGLEYLGTSFQGWQSQPHGHTIQDYLNHAIEMISKHPVVTHAAGRTDTGVHAHMQIVHFDTDASRPIHAWVQGVNRYLPPDISVRWACEAPDPSFHARFSAVARHYRYFLYCHPVRSALNHGRIGWTHYSLENSWIEKAMAHCLGSHDFSSFRASMCQAKSPIKLLTEASLITHGQILEFRFSANGFLHHMVRNLVGALVYVGKKQMTPEDFLGLLESRDRTKAPPTFMPDGLYFHGVSYDHAYALPYPSRGTIHVHL
jgi:tRNA pseudouridine38-40 synthase